MKYSLFKMRDPVDDPLLSIHTWGHTALLKSINFSLCRHPNFYRILVVNDFGIQLHQHHEGRELLISIFLRIDR
jgi:hypothetical protein